jgi:hypothetical protein
MRDRRAFPGRAVARAKGGSAHMAGTPTLLDEFLERPRFDHTSYD